MDTVMFDDKKSKNGTAIENAVLVAIDDGYADTKVVTQSGLSITIPSRVRTGAHALIEAVNQDVESFAGSNDASYQSEGRKFTVGRFIQGEDTRFDGFHLSPLNRVIIHHALRAAGMGGKRVKIATGLPVGTFYRDGLPNNKLIEDKRHNLKVPVTPVGTTLLPCALVEQAYVCAQGVTAWIDFAMMEDGTPNAEYKATAPIGVVDIGGRTTDCVVVLPPAQIDPSRTGTINVGALDVREALTTKICDAFDIDTLPDQLAENALRTGKIRLSGEEHDVTALKEDALLPQLTRVEDAILRFFGRGVDLERIIFVGGGADLMCRLTLPRKNAIVVAHAAYANARGMLKFLALTEKLA